MIDYNEDWLAPLLFSLAGSVFLRSCCFAVPAACMSLGLLVLDDYLPDIRTDYDIQELDYGTLWSASTAGIMLMIGFRTKLAIQRFWEGTGLLHQMRGEWFDTCSNCVSFTLSARHKRAAEVERFRHTMVRLMSLCHGNALEEISGNIFELETIDVYGLSKETLNYMKICHEEHKFNKVELCVHLIQTLITKALHDGVLDIPPPILSRVYQTLSRGFVNLLNTKKITDTKFPFPYAQLIAFLTILYTALTPILLSSFIRNKVLAAIFSFVPVFVVSAVNFISIELENPFGKDDNDLPLAHFQEEMDTSLLMLLHPHTDTIAGLGHSCNCDFYDLFKNFEEREYHVTDGDGRFAKSLSDGVFERGSLKNVFGGIFKSVTKSLELEETERNSTSTEEVAERCACVSKVSTLLRVICTSCCACYRAKGVTHETEHGGTRQGPSSSSHDSRESEKSKNSTRSNSSSSRGSRHSNVQAKGSRRSSRYAKADLWADEDSQGTGIGTMAVENVQSMPARFDVATTEMGEIPTANDIIDSDDHNKVGQGLMLSLAHKRSDQATFTSTP